MQDTFRLIFSIFLVLAVTACSSTITQPSGVSQAAAVAAAKAKTEARYDIKQDLGPKQHRDMSKAPDAVPQIEPLSRGGNKSTYEVWGKSYSVMASSLGFKQRGLASWYGQKFHGHLTSNGETYDMYAMSAAHKSLPLPTYARITNLANNKVVIVRVNDRGPFHGDRVIDLSYAAASKLDYRKTGVAQVLVEAIDARQWSLELEKNIRKQRSGGSISSSQSDVNTSTQFASKPVVQAQASSRDEIRQQYKRVADYYVQVAAVSQIGSALLLRNTLEQELRRSNVFVEQASDRADLFRVLIGPVTDANSAVTLIQQLAELGRGQGLMIKP
ncbi:MAG: rare lipoprotein A [Oceanospirillaceae bacterium]|jgi:rare lipoprotein A